MLIVAGRSRCLIPLAQLRLAWLGRRLEPPLTFPPRWPRELRVAHKAPRRRVPCAYRARPRDLPPLPAAWLRPAGTSRGKKASSCCRPSRTLHDTSGRNTSGAWCGSPRCLIRYRPPRRRRTAAARASGRCARGRPALAAPASRGASSGFCCYCGRIPSMRGTAAVTAQAQAQAQAQHEGPDHHQLARRNQRGAMTQPNQHVPHRRHRCSGSIVKHGWQIFCSAAAAVAAAVAVAAAAAAALFGLILTRTFVSMPRPVLYIDSTYLPDVIHPLEHLLGGMGACVSGRSSVRYR